MGGPELSCQLQPTPAGVDGHHVADGPVGQRRDGEKPDRAAPDNGHPVPRLHLALVHRLHADRGWFGQCGDLQRHVIGDREQSSPLGRLAHQEERGETAFICSAAEPAQSLVGWVDDDPVARSDDAHLASDPLDHAGHLVAQRHRSPGDAAHVYEGNVGAADPAGRHPYDGVARTRWRRRDVVESDVARAMDPDLLHRAGLASTGRTLPSPTAAQYAVPTVAASAEPSGIPPERRGV